MIAGETLPLFASTAMLTTEIFLRTNNNWEDRAKAGKTWAKWKAAYNKSHAKAQVKAQANEGAVKFGVANVAARFETTHEVETNHGIDKGGMKSLEGYFDNLAAAAVNEKSVLEQLVSNSTKLAATNEDLVALVKKLTNEINNLESNTSRLKKTGKQVN